MTQNANSQNLQQLLAILAEAGAKDSGAVGKGDVTVVRSGQQITLPEGMSTKQAITWLERKVKEEETQVAIDECVDAYPFEGAYAFQKALAKTYGWVDLVPTPGFFSDRPPVMVGVEVAPGRVVQVPWGRLQIPGIEGYLDTGFTEKEGRLVFSIRGAVKQRHKEEVAKLANLTRELVRTESIYRGKAIEIDFKNQRDEDGNIQFNPHEGPKFLDLKKVNPEELVFSKSLRSIVEVNIFTPVQKTDECRKLNIPLKRGILLEGPYGTGKTLTAYVLAKMCIENNWTFIYLKSVSDLQRAISFASMYQPCVIFAEDIDRILSGERSEEMDKILNIIDGVSSKANELMIVLTTNKVEAINAAMLRPGRLDTVISVRPPDATAAMQLVELYARGLLDSGDDFTQVGKLLEGQIPAVIREVVERSKLAALQRGATLDHLTLRASDLEVTTESMLQHLKLLEPKAQDKRNNIEKFGDAIGGHMAQSLHNAVQKYMVAGTPEHKGNGASRKLVDSES